MNKRKTLQELTITDGFMFGAVMEDPENCRLLLERILERPISKVNVITEKSLTYRPEYRGVRLDVYASDESGTRFEVEMQVRSTPIEKRSRYYHSQMDMELLLSGTDYEDLTDSYVIFICCYDHFKQGKYRYTVQSHCKECPDIDVNDGVHTIVLNNRGTNPDEVPKELVSFLEYTRRTLAELEDESDDPYIRRLQNSIQRIKNSRKMEEKYMQFQEMLKEEHKEGHEEGRQHFAFDMILDGLLSLEAGAERLNMKPEELKEKLDEYRASKEANTEK